MANKIRQFLTAPKFGDEDKTRIGRYIYLITDVELVVILFISVGVPILSQEYSPRTFLVILAVPFVLYQMILTQKGWVKLAATVQIASAWVVINYSTLGTGGVRSVGFAGNLVIILAAGMLISLRTAWIFGGLSAVLGLILAVGQSQGLLPPMPEHVNAYTAWITQTAFLMLNAGLLYVTVDNIRQALYRTRRAEARLRTLVENSPDIILEINPEGKLTFINRFADFYLGEYAKDLAAPEFVDRLVQAIQRVFETGLSSNLEIQIMTHTNRVIWCAIRMGPIVQDNHVTSLTAILTDITRQKEAQEQILQLNESLEQRVVERTRQFEAANRELESFSYSVSHDLRAPLRSIHGFSQALVDDYSEILSGEAKNFLERIHNSAHKMGTLIDALLNLSRTNRQDINPTKTNLTTLAQEVFDEMYVGSHDQCVEFLLTDLPAVNVDYTLFRQVFVNLIGNAIKYSRYRKLAKIEVGTLEKNGEQIIFVRDNGAGFDMRYVDKLFGTFQRLHHEGEFEGTGIGLATVQRIIHRHGGRIWAEAEVDKGATFYFTVGDMHSS